MLPKLNHQRIKLLENTNICSCLERLELLNMLMGNQFTTEVGLDGHVAEKQKLLNRLGLKFFVNSYQHSKRGLTNWLQVAPNSQILDFIKRHSLSMSVMEAGLLYGYPHTAILAFANLIPRSDDHQTISAADLFFGLVHSSDRVSEERDHYAKILKRIRPLAPKLYSQIQTDFDEYTRSSGEKAAR